MRIIKYGTMTFVEGQGPKIEGWHVERTEEDPEDATMEQLLLGFVLLWAKAKFDEATKSQSVMALREMALKGAAIKAAKGEVN